jgi:putative flavoprotein involved in K+ transport
MVREEIIAYLEDFRKKVGAPLREGVAVRKITQRSDGRFDILASDGAYVADQVVAASGGYDTPIIPALARKLSDTILQLHSQQYRNPQSLPTGAVLVVGAGQSGAQIAEDLHLAGKKVHLAVGDAPRCARFYRGRDVVTWLADMGYYDMPVEKHPLREGVRDNTNHYVTGRDGGRDIDLRQFAREGMKLYGLLEGFGDGVVAFDGRLATRLDEADKIYNGINAAIDKYIAEKGFDAPPPSVYEPVWRPDAPGTSLDLAAEGVTSIIWCIGFRPDFGWLEAPVFNGRGQPVHYRGVTHVPGVYFLGLPWLHTWGSGRFSGIARDAEYIAERVEQAADNSRAATMVAQ